MVPLVAWPSVTKALLVEAFRRPNKTSTITVNGGNVTVDTDGGDVTGVDTGHVDA
jgi:hypothetical protein